MRRRKVQALRALAPADGAAIISVLLVVALVSMIIAGLFVREHVAIRSVENRQALAQSRWIERMAIDWGRFVLRADARISADVDHPGELWATPVDETVLDETVTAGARMEQLPRLRGQVSDAQGMLNLNNLVEISGDGPRPNAAQLAAFRRLLGALDLPETLADLLVARLLPTLLPIGADGHASRLLRLDELRLVAGFDEVAIRRLADYAVFLPTPPGGETKINLNTVSAPVLAAYLDIDPAIARQYVARREKTFFKSVADAKQRLGISQSIDERRFSVASDWFIVRGVVRFGRIENELMSLLHRVNQEVTVQWQHRF